MCYDCWGYTSVIKRDFNAGKVEVSDFDDEFRHAKVAKKKKPKKKRGCPENDYKAHVYVWVEEKHYRSRYTPNGFVEDRSRPPYTVREKTCCGCGHVTNRKYDWSNYYG